MVSCLKTQWWLSNKLSNTILELLKLIFGWLMIMLQLFYTVVRMVNLIIILIISLTLNISLKNHLKNLVILTWDLVKRFQPSHNYWHSVNKTVCLSTLSWRSQLIVKQRACIDIRTVPELFMNLYTPTSWLIMCLYLLSIGISWEKLKTTIWECLTTVRLLRLFTLWTFIKRRFLNLVYTQAKVVQVLMFLVYTLRKR